MEGSPINIRRYLALVGDDGASVADSIMGERLRDVVDWQTAIGYVADWNAKPWLRPGRSAWRPMTDAERDDVTRMQTDPDSYVHDSHSASRRADILETEAPHLIAPMLQGQRDATIDPRCDAASMARALDVIRRQLVDLTDRGEREDVCDRRSLTGGFLVEAAEALAHAVDLLQQESGQS